MKLLIVSSAGGHLVKTMLLEQWWTAYDRVWVVRNDPVTNELLKKEKKRYAHFPEHRHVANFFRNLWLAWKVLRQEQPDLIFSMGAGVAVPFFWVGKLLGIKTFFMETFISIPRPTLTGKLVFLFSDFFFVQHPGLLQYYYYPARYFGDVSQALSKRSSRPKNKRSRKRVSTVLVLTGTLHYPATRLVRIVCEYYAHRPEHSIIVQSGTSSVPSNVPRHIHIQQWFSHQEVLQCLQAADVIISTGGEGTCLEALHFSRARLILFPRLAKYGEHVDDQQQEIAIQLQKQGLAECALTPTKLTQLLDQPSSRSKRSTSPSPKNHDEVRLIDTLHKITQAL